MLYGVIRIGMLSISLTLPGPVGRGAVTSESAGMDGRRREGWGGSAPCTCVAMHADGRLESEDA